MFLKRETIFPVWKRAAATTTATTKGGGGAGEMAC